MLLRSPDSVLADTTKATTKLALTPKKVLPSPGLHLLLPSYLYIVPPGVEKFLVLPRRMPSSGDLTW
jgi:hypothetical protein